jgi:hypothetical protein
MKGPDNRPYLAATTQSDHRKIEEVEDVGLNQINIAALKNRSELRADALQFGKVAEGFGECT